MTANELHVLRTIRDENHGLLGGYEAELKTLSDADLILNGPSGWWLSDAGKLVLQAAEGSGGSG
jgi:hypothetical protein